MNGNITTAPLGGNRNIKTKPLFQYDYGQVLKIVGVTLPAAYEVHFSNQLHGVATTQIGNADGVIIPDIYLTTGEPVYAWIYLHTGNSDGETEYTITIPVVRRASISDAEPTPVQQDVITQAIAALNTAVEQTAQDVQDATEAKQDAEEAAGNAYESAVAAAQSAANAGTYAGQAQTAQAAAELAQQKAEDAQTGARAAQWAAESAQTAAEAAQAGAVAARTGAETAQAWAVAARSGAEAAQHAAEAARDEITGLSATATTLPAGSDATASYSNGLLTIGVPKGEKGDHGDTGATPDLTIGTVQTLPAGSSATASITGTDEQPVLNLGIPKGDTGEVTQAEFDALADDVSDMQDTLEHKADIDGYYTDMTVGAAEQVVSSTMVEDSVPYKLRTSGGSTDIGNRAYVDKVVGGTVAWNQQVRDAASENVTEYADVVTVTDAVEDDAAVSVKVELVQDLHGYDAPWPAGGGKNKLQVTAVDDNTTHSGLTLTTNPDGTIKITGTSTGSNFGFGTATLPAGTYTFSHGTNLKGFYLNISGVKNSSQTGSDFTLSEEQTVTVRCLPPANGTVVNGYLEPMIRLSTSASGYAPYSNICPISGWDEVKVYDDQRYGGLVEWNQICYQINVNAGVYGIARTLVDGAPRGLHYTGTSENTTNYTATNNDNLIEGHKVLYDVGCDLPAGCRINFSNADQVRAVILTIGGANKTFGVIINSGTTVDFTAYPMIYDLTQMFGAGNEPTTVEQFKALFPADNYPYNAGETMTVGQVNGETYRHYTIEMPTEAGTVYGGVLTVNKDGTGSLVVDRASVDLGTLSWVIQTNYSVNRFGASVSGMTKATSSPYYNNLLCSAYKPSNIPIITVNESGTIGRYNGWIYVCDAQFSDVESFKAAMSGVQLVYELETPTTYSLTATQVRTLLGTNHVWSDAGQLSLTYTGTDEHLVLTTGRKYLTRINGTNSMVLGAAQTVTAVKGRDNVFDLTQMFGTAVADYVYQQGAGYFRRWFGGSHYVYNAGELLSVEGLQSHDTVGFNQWDEEWENGGISGTNGNAYNANDRVRSKNYIPVTQLTSYYFKLPAAFNVAWYDSSKAFISGDTSLTPNYARTSPANAAYMRFSYGAYSYANDISINLSHNASRNGEYQPYEKHSYPLDSTLTLRGIPKVGTDGVYWDGDEYAYDGGVKRRYGVVDLGTLTWVSAENSTYFLCRTLPINAATWWGINYLPAVICHPYISAKWNDININVADFAISAYSNQVRCSDSRFTDANAFKAAVSGVYLVYELEAPTTETAQPYQHIQSVDDWGAEEFVSTSIVPVGHATRFPANLRDKLQHLPALASANGSYIITQTNGQMVLSPFPAPPTAAGNYLLKATVSGGNATYSWVAQ